MQLETNSVQVKMNDKRIKTRNIIGLCICMLSIAAVALFGLLYISRAADEISLMQEGYRNLSQVNIYAAGQYGRGFIIGVKDDYIDIITSKHLVLEENNVTVEFGNRGLVNSEVVYYFEDMDAALIRMDRNDTDNYLKGAKAVEVMPKEDYDKIPLLKEVYYAKDIYDTELSALSGNWYASDEYIYEINANVGIFNGEVNPGMSGEGVFDEKDRLVGMVIAASDTKGALIPGYRIRKEYMSYVLAKEGKEEQ